MPRGAWGRLTSVAIVVYHREGGNTETTDVPAMSRAVYMVATVSRKTEEVSAV